MHPKVSPYSTMRFLLMYYSYILILSISITFFFRTFYAKTTLESYSGKYLASKLHSYASLVSGSMKT
jgi:hypothetical protein